MTFIVHLNTNNELRLFKSVQLAEYGFHKILKSILLPKYLIDSLYATLDT